MNDTVARIVEIMFQDTEMTDEVAAIRDEVMNNCQERYQDMLDHGMSEDDAVAAVIESLKGMEEVIAQYPKKGQTASYKENDEDSDFFSAEDEEEEDAGEYTFGGADVKQIELTLVNEDVTVEASHDRDFHVEIDGDDPKAISVTLNNGVLRIIRNNEQYAKTERQGTAFTMHSGGRLNFDSDIDSIEKFGRKLGSMLKGIVRVTVNSSFCDGVTVSVPEGFCGGLNLMTTSGDMDVTNVSCKSLRVVTTNGDVSVQMAENSACPKAEIISTSGDLEATLFTDLANLRTTSGDIELEGRCRTLNVSTVSGDINVRADVESCTFRAISGNVDLEFDSDELRSVNGTTISGDVDVSLPSGIGSVAIQTHTISGDVTTHCHTNGYGPCVAGSITTTSGNIDIR